MTHKFFNTDLENDKSEENSEYSDHIHVSPSKAHDEYIDRNSLSAKIFFIALGSFCVLGVAYYVIQWLLSK